MVIFRHRLEFHEFFRPDLFLLLPHSWATTAAATAADAIFLLVDKVFEAGRRFDHQRGEAVEKDVETEADHQLQDEGSVVELHMLRRCGFLVLLQG